MSYEKIILELGQKIGQSAIDIAIINSQLEEVRQQNEILQEEKMKIDKMYQDKCAEVRHYRLQEQGEAINE